MSSIHHVFIDDEPIGTATVSGWGSAPYARRVTGFGARTEEVRQAIKDGREVVLVGAPDYHGVTERRLILRCGMILTRMPIPA